MRDFRIGYAWIRANLRWFLKYLYKRHEIVDKDKVPKRGPFLLATNHQNAFMDSFSANSPLKEGIHSLTRGDVFKSNFLVKVFESFRMIPIYRIRDGKDQMAKNDQTFDRCYEIFKNQRSVIIYPEANCVQRKSLRPLKKGVARIAFGAVEELGWDCGLKVIPAGLNYSNHHGLYSDLMVHYGDPLDIRDYKELYEQNPNKAILQLMKDIKVGIGDRIVNIQQEELYDFFEAVHPITKFGVIQLFDLKGKELHREIQAYQKLIAVVEDIYKNTPEKLEDVRKKVSEYSAGMKKLGITDRQTKQFPNLGESVFKLILMGGMFPITLLAYITNYPPYALIKKIVGGIKDRQFFHSVHFAGQVIVQPLYYLILWAISFIFVKEWPIRFAVLASFPILGWILHRFIFSWQNLSRDLKANKHEEDVKDLVEQRMQIGKTLLTLIAEHEQLENAEEIKAFEIDMER